MHTRGITRKLVTTLAVAIVATLIGTVSPSAPAQRAVLTQDADRVAACATRKRGEVRVTTIQWESGSVSKRRNLTVRRAPFPGERATLAGPRRKGAAIRRCAVRGEGVVVVRTRGLARYSYTPVASQPVVEVPVETHPSPAAPAFVGVWDRPVVLSTADVDESWGVAAAAAAWNVGLPADRQISVTSEPCLIANPACIPVQPHDFTGFYPGLDPSVKPNAAAWQAYSGGVMRACRIGVNPDAPADRRASSMAHEVGHCLGMPHWATEGDGRWTIMTNGWASDTITEWDLAWIRAAYGA